MATFAEVAEFVQKQTGHTRPVTDETSLQSDIGVCGDDMWEFVDEYGKRFEVDVSSFLWYFHSCEEGWNIGGLFFPPPNARVHEIPITVGMLHEFAQLGRWAVEYPPHDPPRSRPDLAFNLFFALLAIVSLAALVFWAGGCAT